MFSYPMGSGCHVVHLGASRPQNIDAVCFIIEWAWRGVYKKRTRTHNTELAPLHPVDLRVT
jgi:hypothetical protein